MTKPARFSSGIVPVRKVEGEWHFLLLRCFSYWDFPKGEVLPKEDRLKAALRELQEETGISEIILPWKDTFYETEPYSKGKVARYYIGKVETSQVALLPNPENGIVEHHEYRWVSLEEALNLVGPRIKKVLFWAKDLIG